MFRPLKKALNSIRKSQSQSTKTAKFANKNKPNKKAKISIQKSHKQNRLKRISRFLLILFTTFVLMLQLSGLGLLFTLEPAYAAANLQIEPITWDFVGLDSNKPESQGPNTYVVGARVCNLSTTEDAVNVKTKFYKDGVDNGYTFIRLQGADTYTFPLIPKNGGANTTAALGYVFDNSNPTTTSVRTKYTINYTPKNCQDFYYNFETTRSTSAWQTYQKYYIEAWADNAGSVQTPRPRQIYIEQLISQSRNYVYGFSCTTAAQSGGASGAVNVAVGETFTCTANAHTATAYPALSFTADIPNVVFQILDVNTTYSSGGVNSTVYGDGCGWIQDPTDPRYHKSPSQCDGVDQYTGGGVGLEVTTKYKIKVIAFPPTGVVNPIKVSNVILDNSGGSYHYNADYGSGINVMNITVEEKKTDLSIDKSHDGNFISGVNSYKIKVTDSASDMERTGISSFIPSTGVAAQAPVVITDTLPTGYTYTNTPLGGTNADKWDCTVYNSNQSISCTYNNGTPANSLDDNFPDQGINDLIFNVNVAYPPAAISSINTATVSASNDYNAANNSDSDPTLLVFKPNLVLTKSDSNPEQVETVSPIDSDKDTDNIADPLPRVYVGDSVNFTFAVNNSSNSVTVPEPILLTDSLPLGLAYTSFSGTNWTCTNAGQNVNCTYDAPSTTVLGTSASTQPLTITAIANNTLAGPITGNDPTSGLAATSAALTNTANVSAATEESSPSDNTSTETLTIRLRVPDANITKSHTGDFVVDSIGQHVITVENTGSVTISGDIVVQDTLPKSVTITDIDSTQTGDSGVFSLSYATAQPTSNGIGVNGSSITWTCGDTFTAPSTVSGICDATDTNIYFKYNGTLAPGEKVQILFNVTPTLDSKIPNNATFNTTASLTNNVTLKAPLNDTATDVITVKPTGTGASVADVQVIKGVYTIPSGTTLVDGTDCSVTDIAGLTQTTLNTYNTVTTNPRVKTCTTSFSPGDKIGYRIVVNNSTSAGPTSARVVLTDLVPAGVTVSQWSCSSTANGTGGNPAVCSPTSVSGTITNINPTLSLPKGGGQATIDVVGTINSASALKAAGITTLENTASIPTVIDDNAVTAPDPSPKPDIVPTNNTFKTITPLNITDLKISKDDDQSGNESSFVVGVEGSYIVTVKNVSANDTVDTIKVLDDLPNNFDFVSASSAPGSSGWVCSQIDSTNNIISCTNETQLAAGASSQIQITVKPKTGTVGNTYVNLAQVITAGDLTTANNGNAPVTSFSGLCTGTPLCTTERVAYNASSTDDDNGTTTNTAANGYEETPVIAPNVDLQITKTLIGGGNLTVGQAASYQISLQNIGQTVATASVGTPIVVTDTLPTGVSYVSANGAGWSCSASGQIVTCNLTSNLGVNQPSTINLNVVVNGTAASSVSNVAAVDKHVNELPVDDVRGNNLSASRNDFTLTNTVNQISDLGIVKTALGSFLKGDDATFQLQVTNNGPSDYTGSVVITDTLDSNFTFKPTGSGGNGFSCSAVGQVVTCTKSGGLTVGQTITFPVVVTVSSSAPTGNLDNTAQFNAATLTSANDPTGDTNDTSTVTVAIQSNTSALTLSKDDGDGETPDEPTTASSQTKFAVGSVSKYTLIVTNAGPASAKKPVTITEDTTLPTGLTYAGYSLTANWKCTGTIGGNGSDLSCIYGQWTDTDGDGDRFEGAATNETCTGTAPSYTNISGSCFVQQDLPANSFSGVEIKVNVTNTANISTFGNPVYTGLTTNTGKVTSANGGSATATEQTAIIQPADLQVTKTGADNLTAPSGTGTYTVTVTNNGPGTSNPDIYLQDYLPVGLTYSGVTSGSAPGDGTWTVVSYNLGSNEVTYKRTTALANGASTTIDVPVTVAANPPASVTNLVRVQGFTPEPIDPSGVPCDASFITQSTNNCATKVTTITGGVATDLSITKVPSTTTPVYNTNFNYTLTVANTSTDAQDVNITDVLPSSLQFVSVGSITPASSTTPFGIYPRTCSLGTITVAGVTTNTNTFSCNFLTIPANSLVSATFTVKGLVSGTIPNTATVSTTTSDTNPNNNSSTALVTIPTTPGLNNISGTIFNDPNNNGTIDSGETGTNNIKVRLYEDTGTVAGAYDAGDPLISTTTTDASGNYSFGLGIKGNFVLNVDTTTLPSGASQTPTGSPIIVQTAVFTSTSGGSDANNNFGYKLAIVPTDYGDAPDTTNGTGANDYQTTSANGGASHVIVPNLKIGTNIDADSGTLQNANADADDTDQSPDDEDGVTLPKATTPALTTSSTTYTAQVNVLNNTGSDAYLVGWIDFNKNGAFDTTEGVVRTVTTNAVAQDIDLPWTGLSGLTTGDTYARFRLSNDVLTADTANSIGAKNSGEVEDYKISIGAVPSLNLVKRITAINGVPLTDFVDGPDAGLSNDNDTKWPDSDAAPLINKYLAGKIACKSGSACNSVEGVKPGDDVEYTIYFLSNGTENLKDVKICDRIPANTTFQAGTYDATAGSEKGILLGWNSASTGSPVDPSDSSFIAGTNKIAITNASDADKGTFFAKGATVDAICGDNSNTSLTNGAVFVQVVSSSTTPAILPKADSSGSPPNSYGFVRFNVKVN